MGVALGDVRWCEVMSGDTAVAVAVGDDGGDVAVVGVVARAEVAVIVVVDVAAATVAVVIVVVVNVAITVVGDIENYDYLVVLLLCM